jgi:maltose O-acetyltransferase
MHISSIITLFRIKQLKRKGLTIGQNVYVGERVSIDSCFCWLVSIGRDCVLGDGVAILAHDASTLRHLSCMKIGKVSLGDRTFVGANSIILPNVKIGRDVVIGAGSVVTKDVPDGVVVVGNPARIIGKTADFVKKHESAFKVRTVSNKTKREINAFLENEIGYIN